MLVQADFTCDSDLHAWMKLFLEVAAMEPDNAARACVICQACCERGRSSVALTLCGFERAHDSHGLVGLDILDFFRDWGKDMVSRVVFKQVVDGLDSELGQDLSPGRANAFNELHGCVWLNLLLCCVVCLHGYRG